MRSRIEAMGSIMPAPPFPYHPLHYEGHGQLVEDVPGTGAESRPLHQGSTCVNRRSVFWFPKVFFRIHPVVQERGEGDFGRGWKVDTYVLEVTAVCNLLDHLHEWGSLHADPGYYDVPA